jgi:hypothetical protein
MSRKGLRQKPQKKSQSKSAKYPVTATGGEDGVAERETVQIQTYENKRKGLEDNL